MKPPNDQNIEQKNQNILMLFHWVRQSSLDCSNLVKDFFSSFVVSLTATIEQLCHQRNPTKKNLKDEAVDVPTICSNLLFLG